MDHTVYNNTTVKTTIWNTCNNDLDELFWILNGVLGVLIVAGNSFTCFVFLRSRPPLRQNFLNNFLLSLAVSDLLMALTVIPMYSVFCSGCIYAPTRFCWLFDVFRDCSFLSSVFNLFVIAYDRNTAIFKPLLYHYYMNIKTLKHFMFCVWGIPIILTLIRFTWRFSLPEEVAKTWNRNYTLFLLYVFVCLPMLVVGFINVRILLSINRMQFRRFNKVDLVETSSHDKTDIPSLNNHLIHGVSTTIPQRNAIDVVQQSSPSSSKTINNLKLEETLDKLPEDEIGRLNFKSLNPSTDTVGFKKNSLSEDISKISESTSGSDNNKLVSTTKRIGCYNYENKTFMRRPDNDKVCRLASETVQKHKETARNLKIRKGTISCVTVTAVFVLCWIPRAFYQQCRLFDRRDLVNPLLIKLSLFFLFLQSSLNPFIYSFYRSEFRRAALKLMKLR